MFAYWTHDLDPFIIEFWEGFGLRWYGLSYVLGILAVYWFLNRWARAKRVPLWPGEASDLLLYAGLGMVLGGRIGYSVLYAGEALARDPLYVFRIWEGGMASHGGIVGIGVGTALFAWKRKRNYLVLGDQLCALGPLGVAMTRVANFINGELWGKVTDVPWAVIFPAARLADGSNPPRHPSQLYAAVLEGLLLFAILAPIHKRHRRPGLTMALFFALYGVGRFVGEFWREPDVGQPVYFGWMSKGQAFTIPMFVIGVVAIAVIARRPAQPDRYVPPPPPPAAD